MSFTENGNSDYEVLGFEDDVDLAERFALTREVPLFRSTSELLLVGCNGVSEEEEVYRGVQVPRQQSDFTDACYFRRESHFFETEYEFSGLKKQQMNTTIEHISACDIAQLNRPISECFLPVVYAFSNLSGEELLEHIKKSCKECKVDCNGFDVTTSSFAAKCKSGVRFDIYVQEVLPQEQSIFGRYLIEVQRLSSGCITAWQTTLAELMSNVGPVCNDKGYFETNTETPVSGARSLLSERACDFDCFDEMDLEPVDQTVIDSEYTNLLRMLSDSATSFENKIQLCNLLKCICESREGAEAVLRVSGMDTVLRLLQNELLMGGIKGDLNSALCEILAKLSSFPCENPDLGAYISMEVLRNSSCDQIELAQLRNAAKALSSFVKRLQNKKDLKPAILETVRRRCAECRDNEFTEYSNNILRSLCV